MTNNENAIIFFNVKEYKWHRIPYIYPNVSKSDATTAKTLPYHFNGVADAGASNKVAQKPPNF